MINEFLDICGIRRRELEHKKKMDKAYFRLDFFSMIFDKFSPLIFELFKLTILKLSNKNLSKNIPYHKKLF